jgi:serine protease inhibitor
MKATEQTLQQIERAIRKIAEKFPANDDATLMTDIHIRVTQETGELMAFDDDDNEITRCVVEQWIDNKDDDFYASATTALRTVVNKQKNTIDKMSILKPFSLVLEDDDKETVAELYVADDDTVIIDEELMKGLDKDLDNFFEKLIKE